MEHSPFDSYFDDNEYSSDDDEESKESRKKKKRASIEARDRSADKRSEKEAPDKASAEVKERRTDILSLLEKDKKSRTEAVDDDVPELGDEAEIAQAPEALSEAELQLITRQIVEDRDKQLKDELTSAVPESPQEAEVLGGALFIDGLAEAVNEGRPVDDELLDEVVAEVAGELDIEVDEDDASVPYEVSSIVGVEDDHEPDEDPVEVSPVTSPATPTPSTPPTPLPSRPLPPSPPSPPASPGRPTGPSFLGGPMGPLPGSAGFSALRPPTPRVEVSANRYQRGADLLVGGIVGYLIGRRRGRLKAEARLVPVQKSLEKQVKDLHQKISLREQTVRSLVSEKVAREGEDVRRAIAEKVEAKAKAKTEAVPQTPLPEATVPSLARIEKQPNDTDQLPRMETNRSEKLAGAVISQTEVRPAVTKEAVQRMAVNELLKVAAAVEVNGVSAKQLYEQGRVTKEDLREVVTEQLLGKARTETVLAERMRPIFTTETKKEYVPRDPADPVQAIAAIGANVRAASPKSEALQPLSEGQADVSAMADALIAQQAVQDHQPQYSLLPWIILGVLIAIMGIALLTF